MADQVFKTDRIVGKTSAMLFWNLNHFSKKFLKSYEYRPETETEIRDDK